MFASKWVNLLVNHHWLYGSEMSSDVFAKRLRCCWPAVRWLSRRAKVSYLFAIIALTLTACSDAPEAGGTPDMQVGDLGADAAIDSSTVAGACNDGAVVEETYQSDMVVCQSVGQAVRVNQCAASASFCNDASGWEMCTASQFLDRGGKTTPALTTAAWIAGCVRDGEDPLGVLDGACGSCLAASGSLQTLRWRCQSGTPLSFDQRHVGLASDSICYRAGTDSSSYEAHWGPLTSDGTLPAAVCCK